MDFKLYDKDVKLSSAEIVVGGLYKNEAWPAWLKKLDNSFGGKIKKLAQAQSFKGDAGGQLEYTEVSSKSKTIYIIGLGDKKFQEKDHIKVFAGKAVSKCRSSNLSKLLICAPSFEKDESRVLSDLGIGASLGDYRFDVYMSDKKNYKKLSCEIFQESFKQSRTMRLKVLNRAKLIGECTSHARHLVNESPSKIYPASLAAHAQAIARKGKLKIKILDKKQIAKEKMFLYLAVGEGATKHPPKFVHLTYTPAKKQGKKRIFLIGKGITFDSGGLSLKPGGAMEDMKIDMSGSATVLSTMEAIAGLKPNVEIHALVAAAENMPDGDAYRPGDVIVSRSGKSVEILNTDAEGRLTLADAITWAKDHGATEIIELSTLTGACMIALGPDTAGLFSNNDTLAQNLKSAADAEGEDIWRMPLTPSLKAALKSPVADLKNVGDRKGGAITAGLFLEAFAGDTPFAHLDIAGPATSDVENGHIKKGGRGFGVATLLEYLCPLK